MLWGDEPERRGEMLVEGEGRRVGGQAAFPSGGGPDQNSNELPTSPAAQPVRLLLLLPPQDRSQFYLVPLLPSPSELENNSGKRQPWDRGSAATPASRQVPDCSWPRCVDM